MIDYFRPATEAEQAMGIIAVLCCEEMVRAYSRKAVAKSSEKPQTKQAKLDLDTEDEERKQTVASEENLAVAGWHNYLREIPYFERHMINRYELGNHFKGAEWWVADFEAYLEAIYETD